MCLYSKFWCSILFVLVFYVIMFYVLVLYILCSTVLRSDILCFKTLKRLRGERGQFDSTPYGFSKNGSSREKLDPWFFCDFKNYHRSHLSWKFHWNSSSFLEDMKIFSVNINYFHQFFEFFENSYLQRN